MTLTVEWWKLGDKVTFRRKQGQYMSGFAMQLRWIWIEVLFHRRRYRPQHHPV